jgi:hypothetical protein
MYDERDHFEPDKVFRRRIGLHEIPLKYIKPNYRLSLSQIKYIRDIVSPTMKKFNTNHTIPLDSRILLSLDILASGNYQRVTGFGHGMSRSSVQTIFHEFLDTMLVHANDFIKFPIDDPVWVASSKASFQRIAGLPNIVAVVDGTHISIEKPKVNGQVYVGRKPGFTINVQVKIPPKPDENNNIIR